MSPRAVPIAVGLFALDDWLIYYAAEIKQYCSDTTLTLVALLLAAAAADLSRRSLVVLAGFGAVGVWFSHPLALVLAAVGTYLAAKAAIRRDWKKMPGLVGMGLLWAISFAACYVVSHRILSKDQFIWNWWDFAFLPIPPRSFADLERDFWQVINIFNSPAWVVTPLGVLASAFLAMGLYLIGSLSLGLRWRGGLYLLVAPLLFTLAASALRQYPFHGRLLLFLVPTSICWSRKARRRSDAPRRRRSSPLPWARFAVSAGIRRSLAPVGRETHSRWVRLARRPLPDLLDYLETRQRAARGPRTCVELYELRVRLACPALPLEWFTARASVDRCHGPVGRARRPGPGALASSAVGRRSSPVGSRTGSAEIIEVLIERGASHPRAFSVAAPMRRLRCLDARPGLPRGPAFRRSGRPS